MDVKILSVLTVMYTIIFCILISTCYAKRLKKYHVVTKSANSIGFIVVATYGYIVSGDRAFFYSILPALILCLFGDVLLALYDTTLLNKYFISGLASFLFAHIVFVFALSTKAPFSFYDLILPTMGVLATAFLSKLKNMNMRNMRACVLVYSFFVVLLFSKGVSFVLINGLSLSNVLLCLGSLLFVISDGLILFLYFYEIKHPIIRFFNLNTYYYGMFFIALSLIG